MTKGEAIETYGEKGDITFENFKRDSHRERWSEGDWTDDSGITLISLISFF
jgi:hypothetical protein